MKTKLNLLIGIGLINLLWLGHPTSAFADDAAKAEPVAKEAKKKESKKKEKKEAVAPTTLVSVDNKKGAGAEAKAGQTVSVHYTGWLWENGKKGKKFDSSLDRKAPFDFQLGTGQVIKGWDQGVAGMKVGGKRTLTIPPDLGYGPNGAGAVIPPNATLIFDVELLGVK